MFIDVLATPSAATPFPAVPVSVAASSVAPVPPWSFVTGSCAPRPLVTLLEGRGLMTTNVNVKVEGVTETGGATPAAPPLLASWLGAPFVPGPGFVAVDDGETGGLFVPPGPLPGDEDGGTATAGVA
jgi:hypothetical protein